MALVLNFKYRTYPDSPYLTPSALCTLYIVHCTLYNSRAKPQFLPIWQKKQEKSPVFLHMSKKSNKYLG